MSISREGRKKKVIKAFDCSIAEDVIPSDEQRQPGGPEYYRVFGRRVIFGGWLGSMGSIERELDRFKLRLCMKRKKARENERGIERPEFDFQASSWGKETANSMTQSIEFVQATVLTVLAPAIQLSNKEFPHRCFGKAVSVFILQLLPLKPALAFWATAAGKRGAVVTAGHGMPGRALDLHPNRHLLTHL
jgi:hypothetical protein